MTTENPTVGQTGAEGAADANPLVSPPTSPPIEGEVTKLLTALESKLNERFSSLENNLTGLKKVQGDIDRSRSAFQEQLARFNQIKAQGNLSDEQALQTMQRVDEDAQFREEMRAEMRKLAERVGGIGSTPTEQQMMTEVLSEFNLDPKDPFVASQLNGKNFTNRLEAEAFAGKILRDKVKAPNPTPAQAASSAGVPSTPPDVESLAIEYDQLSRNPSANIERMREIRKVLDGIK